MYNDIKVLLVDDSEIFREALKNVLIKLDMIDVIDELNNGKNLLNYLKNNQVDVLLLDANTVNLKGIESVKLIHDQYPEVRIIGLSSYDYKREMLDAGAFCFFNKWEANYIEIKEAILERVTIEV